MNDGEEGNFLNQSVGGFIATRLLELPDHVHDLHSNRPIMASIQTTLLKKWNGSLYRLYPVKND